jgi:hypothetical protein
MRAVQVRTAGSREGLSTGTYRGNWRKVGWLWKVHSKFSYEWSRTEVVGKML